MIRLMILQRKSLALAPFIITFLLVASSAIARSPIKCQKYCGNGQKANRVPYPFGFSSDCPIQLNCTRDDIQIGGFQVQNITPDGIFIIIPADCNRPLESIKSLFGKNYALALRSNLLLQNCSKKLAGCTIPGSFLEREQNISNCHSGSEDVSCYSPEDSEIKVFSYKNVKDTQCKRVFSSLTMFPGSPVVSLQFNLAGLEWWLDGSCDPSDGCDKNANCNTVRHGNGKVGFRCRCRDGFVGDGFAAGDGCRRVPDCSTPRYMSGQCGGTVRVGVLVGGKTFLFSSSD
uniref:EGF-like domain-containing protein n=1 Tax=Rhizophora mucronata TaxID=61149 RepID=A0A2P2MSP6_RHIMU